MRTPINIKFGQNYILIKDALSIETVNKILDLPNHCEKVIDRSRFRDFGTYNDNSIHYRDDYIGNHYNYHYESPMDNITSNDDHEIFLENIPKVEKFKFGSR